VIKKRKKEIDIILKHSPHPLQQVSQGNWKSYQFHDCFFFSLAYTWKIFVFNFVFINLL